MRSVLGIVSRMLIENPHLVIIQLAGLLGLALARQGKSKYPRVRASMANYKSFSLTA